MYHCFGGGTLDDDGLLFTEKLATNHRFQSQTDGAQSTCGIAIAGVCSVFFSRVLAHICIMWNPDHSLTLVVQKVWSSVLWLALHLARRLCFPGSRLMPQRCYKQCKTSDAQAFTEFRPCSSVPSIPPCLLSSSSVTHMQGLHEIVSDAEFLRIKRRFPTPALTHPNLLGCATAELALEKFADYDLASLRTGVMGMRTNGVTVCHRPKFLSVTAVLKILSHPRGRLYPCSGVALPCGDHEEGDG